MSALTPPQAPQKPSVTEHHGVRIEDPWAWLKDPNYPKVETPEILAYLKAENAYFEASLAPQKPLVDQIFAELKGRLKEDDESVPSKDGDYLYHWKFETGGQYRAWYRAKIGGGARELLLDENELAKGLDYFALGSLEVSPNDRLMAYSTDTDGGERFTLRVRDLTTGELLPDEIEETQGGAVWNADSSGFFYTLVNENWRPYVVKYHQLGADPAADPVIYEESDSGFFVGVGQTQSRAFIVISAADHVTSENYLIPANAPLSAPRLVSARQTNRMYDVDEREGTLFILTNDTHVNFRIATASVERPDVWSELVAGSDRHYLRDLTAFRDLLVIEERIDGLDQIRVRDYAGGEHYIQFPESTYAAGVATNAEYEVTKLRLSYESLITPRTVFDYDLGTRTLETLKEQAIPSGYDRSQYDSVRLIATARDGAKVPVSVVFKRDFPRDGSGPLYLYSYGAYGHAVPPGFSSARLSLLDRGFAFAIAHIRGGDDLGYQWYLDGKLDKRENTFRDFVDVAKALIAERFTSAGQIAISGGSAGGTLVGVAANLAPELWRAVIAHVPFVDVLNTMLDDSLPLTPMEWPEWGNPITDATAFETILAYSPYENVTAKNYPAFLITAGLNDPRVTYWEPAKWAAKLRAVKTDSSLLLLKTNMGAGHGGKSGRFERLSEVAEEYAFILKTFGRG